MYGIRAAAACSAPSFYLSAWSYNKSHAAIAWTWLCIPSCSFDWLLLRLSCCCSTTYSWVLNLSFTLALFGPQCSYTLPHSVCQVSALTHHNWEHTTAALQSTSWVLTCGFNRPSMGPWYYSVTSPEARVGILTHHSKAVLLYDIALLVLSYCGILSYQGLHHCCILPTPSVAEANNKHRPQFHGRIIYACTLETVTAAPANTVVPQGQSDTVVPHQPDLRSLAPLPFWVPICIFSATVNFHGPKRRTVGPQKPLLPSTSMALANTTTTCGNSLALVTEDPCSLHRCWSMLMEMQRNYAVMHSREQRYYIPPT